MKTIYHVEGMHCGHCANAIKGELIEIEGVQTVEVNLEEKTVEVEHTETVEVDFIKNSIEELGYEVIG